MLSCIGITLDAGMGLGTDNEARGEISQQINLNFLYIDLSKDSASASANSKLCLEYDSGSVKPWLLVIIMLFIHILKLKNTDKKYSYLKFFTTSIWPNIFLISLKNINKVYALFKKKIKI